MKIRVSDSKCPRCSAGGTLFKVQGQTEPMCAECLKDYALQQGVDKNIVVDGITTVESGPIGELVLGLFNAGTTAHLMHLMTTSFAAHKALDEFYESVVDLTDKFIEAYQGKYGVVNDYPALAVSVEADPVAFLSALSETFKGQRNSVSRDDTELHNLLDEIATLIDSSLYKLKTLK